MKQKPTQIKAGRGIVAIRKDVDPQVATEVRRICLMFKRICDLRPDVVRETFSDFLRQRETVSGSDMVEFYAEDAEHLAELFNYQ